MEDEPETDYGDGVAVVVEEEAVVAVGSMAVVPIPVSLECEQMEQSCCLTEREGLQQPTFAAFANKFAVVGSCRTEP